MWGMMEGLHTTSSARTDLQEAHLSRNSDPHNITLLQRYDINVSFSYICQARTDSCLTVLIPKQIYSHPTSFHHVWLQ
jgi:hypothetical protein